MLNIKSAAGKISVLQDSGKQKNSSRTKKFIKAGELTKNPYVTTTVLIALCFLLSSTGWLSWEYHLLEQLPAGLTDICTMVFGYLLQAAGIGFFALMMRRQKSADLLFFSALLLHMLCMVTAVTSPHPVNALVFGLLMNVFCGMIAGYYLHALAVNICEERKAIVFGIGYAIAIVSSWLLSLIGSGAFYYSGKILILCAVLTVAGILIRKMGIVQENADTDSAVLAEYSRTGRSAFSEPGRRKRINFLLLASVLVLLFSAVNSSGFAFPVSDLGQGINIECSRLVYAAGLIIAGIVTDRNRKYGAICALAALIIPFIILALRGEVVSTTIFWILSYFIFGFYAVYRIILFSDFAVKNNLVFLSGFGLLFGRIGDAIGEGICLLLANHLAIMVILTAVLFGVSVAVFFKVYQSIYIPENTREQTEQEKFYQFSIRHDLSAREQDMLHLVLDRKTNGEIAEALSISENTVKFHVRNLLQKTGCKNRKELIAVYMGNAAEAE